MEHIRLLQRGRAGAYVPEVSADMSKHAYFGTDPSIVAEQRQYASNL